MNAWLPVGARTLRQVTFAVLAGWTLFVYTLARPSGSPPERTAAEASPAKAPSPNRARPR